MNNIIQTECTTDASSTICQYEYATTTPSVLVHSDASLVFFAVVVFSIGAFMVWRVANFNTR